MLLWVHVMQMTLRKSSFGGTWQQCGDTIASCCPHRGSIWCGIRLEMVLVAATTATKNKGKSEPNNRTLQMPLKKYGADLGFRQNVVNASLEA